MEKCTEAVVNWMIKYNAINEEEKKLYEYALHSVVLLILPLLLAGGIGFCFGSIKSGIILMSPFMILRKFSGGYHAQKLFHCVIGSGLLLFLCIMFAMRIKCDWKLLVVTAIASVSLMIFSPIDNENRQFDNNERYVYKRTIVCFVCVLDVLGIVLFLLGYYETTACMCIGIQMTTGLQLPCIVKKYVK